MSAGTTAQRPTGVAGMFRYNTTEDKFEGYSNSWGEIGGGAADLRVNSFTGDGSTVAYSLSSSPDLSNTLVYIDGIYQVKAAYAMSGQTLTFTAAPDNGALIEITAATVAPVQESTDFLINNFTGNNSTTAFSLSSTPTSENQCSVFISGVYQSKANFSVSGSTLTFSTPPPSGSAIEVMCARTVVFGIGTPDDNTVSTVKIQDDAVTSAKVDGTVATVAGTETLTNKTLTAPTINGGTHTAFTSTGIDDNATSTAITIDQNENVGVGSAPDAWASGYSAIDVGSAGSLWATTAGANLTAISDNSFYDGTTYVAKNTGHGSMYFQNLGNHYWRNFASVSGGAVQTGVDKMQLTAAGNLDLIDGNLEVAAGHGIDFSANSHAGGMTSELLDSYETGTFVPTFQSLSGTQPTLTYVSQVGYYTKIGNIVHVSGGLSLNGMVDGTNGTFVIADLPFNIAHICVGSHTGSQLTMTLGAYQLSLYTANRIGFLGAGASGTSWGWHSINSILGPTSALRFSLTYETA